MHVICIILNIFSIRIPELGLDVTGGLAVASSNTKEITSSCNVYSNRKTSLQIVPYCGADFQCMQFRRSLFTISVLLFGSVVLCILSRY